MKTTYNLIDQGVLSVRNIDLPMKTNCCSMQAVDIQKATHQLMKNHGLENFKTLTTDNGSGFSTLLLIEEKEPAVQVFFTHAYASWKMGTYERHNGMLREFVPKVKSLKNLNYAKLKAYTDDLNNHPRKTLDFKTPRECMEEAI